MQKEAERDKLKDSLFKGVFLLFGPLSVVLLLAIIVGTLTRGNTDDEGYDRVWSAEHGHWHAKLPDGSEVEVRPGMVWDEDHGHFHFAEAPTGAAPRHLESRIQGELEAVGADVAAE